MLLLMMRIVFIMMLFFLYVCCLCGYVLKVFVWFGGDVWDIVWDDVICVLLIGDVVVYWVGFGDLGCIVDVFQIGCVFDCCVVGCDVIVEGVVFGGVLVWFLVQGYVCFGYLCEVVYQVIDFGDVECYVIECWGFGYDCEVVMCWIVVQEDYEFVDLVGYVEVECVFVEFEQFFVIG